MAESIMGNSDPRYKEKIESGAVLPDCPVM